MVFLPFYSYELVKTCCRGVYSLDFINYTLTRPTETGKTSRTDQFIFLRRKPEILSCPQRSNRKAGDHLARAVWFARDLVSSRGGNEMTPQILAAKALEMVSNR
jgi:hypothetical protein